jgi:hypothetical protein
MQPHPRDDEPMRIRVAAAALSAAVALTAVVALGMFGGTPVGAEPSVAPVPAVARVGAVFFPSVLSLPRLLPLPHVCSGSVVHSASGDVVLTAAHCIFDSGAGYQFAPGYHDGVFPFGLWTVRRVYVDPAWLHGHDPRHDYALLTVAPRTISGVVRSLESVVGSYQLGTAPTTGQAVTVIGYRLGVRDQPLGCTAATYDTDGYPSLDCDGFVDGTSGGPWLSGDTVVGLIGGLHQGGCTPQTVYSSVFDAATAAVLARAGAGGRGDLVTPAGGPGC